MKIKINSLKELISYSKIKKDIMKLEFSDVEFDCAIPDIEYWNTKINLKINKVILIAKNVTFNYESNCSEVYCENLVVKKALNSNYIDVKNKIEASRIYSKYLLCSSLECYDVECSIIECKKLQATNFCYENSNHERKLFSYVIASNVSSVEGNKHDKNK